MTEPIKTQHKDVLNALSEMQQSPAYAARRTTLRQAEQLIYRQEQQIKRLVMVTETLAELAKDVPNAQAFIKENFDAGNESNTSR